MVEQEEYLEETYGPAARYAEHQRGDTSPIATLRPARREQGRSSGSARLVGLVIARSASPTWSNLLEVDSPI